MIINKWQLIPCFEPYPKTFLLAFNWFCFRFWLYKKGQKRKFAIDFPEYSTIREDQFVAIYFYFGGIVIMTKKGTLHSASCTN